jgi:hypothetical protein
MTAEELRKEIAGQRLELYKLAAVVHVHPGRLGMYLNERLPMPADVAERLTAVIRASG